MKELDPSNFIEVTCVVAKKYGTATTQDLNDSDKVDIGRYEYVMVLVSCADVGTGITLVITPKEGDTRSGPEFPLDGTNGAPDYSVTITSTAGTQGTKWAAFSTAGRRRFLQVAVVSAGGSLNASISVNVIGFMRSSEAVLRPFTRTGVLNVGIS